MRGLVTAIIATGILAAAPTASAEIVNLTFTGVVASGIDYANNFGGGDLSFVPFLSSYSFDTSADQVSPDGSMIAAGTKYSPPLLNSDAYIKIRGHVFDLGDYDNSADISTYAITVAGKKANGNILFDNVVSSDLPSSLINSFTLTPKTLYPDGLFEIRYNDGITTVYPDRLVLIDKTLTVTVDGASAIPEPSTWTLLVAGVAGAALRFGRRGWAETKART